MSALRNFPIVLLLFGASCVQAEAYKCSVDGKTVYQDTPCDGGKRLDLPKGNVNQPSTNGRTVGNGVVAVGVSGTYVRSVWGAPSRVFRTTSTSEASEQWIYDRGTDAHYVMFQNGVVTSITRQYQVKP